MGLWDKLRGELIDIVEWTDDSPDTLVWRFERHGNEIKNGAQLVVREGQKAVFVDQGRLADVFAPGRHVLSTSNLPLLSTLQGWKHGFESPFKAEVYFVSTRQFTDLKWGTRNPVILRDPEFGPIRLRAFGTYALRIGDPGAFLREIVGTDGHFTTDEISEQLRNVLVSRFTDLLAESGIPALDLAASYDELGRFVTERIAPELARLGVELTTLLVENISLPPAVEEVLDERTSMGIVGDLSRYTTFQAARALRESASSEATGGLAAGGLGAGLGMAMGQAMARGLAHSVPDPLHGGGLAGTPPLAASGAQPPPVPQAPQVQVYVAQDGAQTGPFHLEVLTELARSGRLVRDTLVWMDGMAAWRPAGEVPLLAGLFPTTPPPLPPGPPA